MSIEDEVHRLRVQVDGLIRERDALLGLFHGLFKSTYALAQSHPDLNSFHLALSAMQDLQEAG